MEFDIKEKVEEIVKKLLENPQLRSNFEKEPVKALESLLGVDLPDEKLQPLVSGIKAKLAASDIGDKLGGLKNLF